MSTNSYSPQWIAHFLHRRDSRQTEAEVAFVEQQLRRGSRVLDLPCGAGRHARLLAEKGYRVVAADRNAALLGAPRPSLAWICADMRALPLTAGRFDAILCLWQSFGYFDAEANADVLRAWAEIVRPGGRLILDLYHRAFFEAHQGERQIPVTGGTVLEASRMAGDRLVVELAYGPSGGGDRFEWQLFYPEDLQALAARCGWRLLLACSGFDTRRPVDPLQPRVQYVLEKGRSDRRVRHRATRELLPLARSLEGPDRAAVWFEADDGTGSQPE